MFPAMNEYRYDIEQSFKKYYGALCYFASRYVVADGDAIEDLVQDCFVKLLERRLRFDSEEYLRNYLYVAVRNNCLNSIQKNKLRARHSALVQQAGEQPEETSEEVFNTEVLRCLMARIEELPLQCRQVIRLSYMDGLDNESIAGMLGLSVNTVRAQKMRGKKLLRLSLGDVAL